MDRTHQLCRTGLAVGQFRKYRWGNGIVGGRGRFWRRCFAQLWLR